MTEPAIDDPGRPVKPTRPGQLPDHLHEAMAEMRVNDPTVALVGANFGAAMAAAAASLGGLGTTLRTAMADPHDFAPMPVQPRGTMKLHGSNPKAQRTRLAKKKAARKARRKGRK